MNSFLRYLWALPASLVGVAAAVPWLALGARARFVEGAWEVAGGKLGRALRPLGFGAITLGHVIIGLDGECLHACREHEQVHVRQYERWGVLLFPLYAAASLVAWLRGGRLYLDNHFEKEARALDARAAGKDAAAIPRPVDSSGRT